MDLEPSYSSATGVHRVHQSPLGCGPVRCRWRKGFSRRVHESTRTRPPLKKHPCPVSGTADRPVPSAALDPSGNGRDATHRHARHSAGLRVEHLFWAMAARVPWGMGVKTRVHCPQWTRRERPIRALDESECDSSKESCVSRSEICLSTKKKNWAGVAPGTWGPSAEAHRRPDSRGGYPAPIGTTDGPQVSAR